MPVQHRADPLQRDGQLVGIGEITGVDVMTKTETGLAVEDITQADLAEVVPALFVVASLGQLVALVGAGDLGLKVENRTGLIREVMSRQADGRAETGAALLMATNIARPGKRVTLGADKAYDRKDFVTTVRELGVTPHVAQNNQGLRSAIDGRTTRHEGYRMSLKKRWIVEKAFGWMKKTGGLKKINPRGLDKVGWLETYSAAAYNLLRVKTLQEKCA
ncbi:MAG: transposase [Acidobacteriota bacterium]